MAIMHCHIGVFEGYAHPQHSQKLYPLPQGVVAHPFDVSARGARPHVGCWGGISASGGHVRQWLCWSLEATVRSAYWRNHINCLRKYFFIPM
jgi:hypothetical protein